MAIFGRTIRHSSEYFLAKSRESKLPILNVVTSIKERDIYCVDNIV